MAEGMTISRRGALAAGAGGLMLAARPAFAAPADDGGAIDAIVAGFMSAFEIPGIGIAVVRPGMSGFARGYGVRTLGRPERVDGDTLFAIASNSKAFVSASLALLIEEGKLGWDDPVLRHMPDFAMHDPAVTAMMTVRDLLLHRSGLPLGAGDLMQFPLTDHSREEMFRALRQLKPVRGFRTGYDYDNILYVVAGMLVERLSGMRWEDFVTARLLRPIGMRGSVAARALIRTANVVGRHARLGPPVRGMGRLEVVAADDSPAATPAGGIQAGVNDMLPWIALQLARGRLPDGRRLWSEAQQAEMWSPGVLISGGPGATGDRPDRPVLSAYALGWFVQPFRERRLVWHSGGLTGQITHVALLPDQGIGLAVYSNTEDSLPIAFLRYALLDHLLGLSGTDWVAAARRRTEASQAQVRALVGAGEAQAPPGGPTLPLARYAGRYRDPWYGDIVFAVRGGRLFVDFTRTPVFKSALEPWGKDAFRTRFAKGAGEDAVIQFDVREGAVAGVRMKALSPLADFSYDFHDLAPTRVA